MQQTSAAPSVLVLKRVTKKATCMKGSKKWGGKGERKLIGKI